ncbi:MAG: VOC family protein [Actinomycetota bacterium]
MSIGFQVTFDAADPDALARFWAVALDYRLQPPPTGFDSWDAWAAEVGIPPEHRNDMSAGPDHDRSLVRAHVERLVAAGASVVAEREQRGEFWIVLQDPEGNEFCVQ